jgi:hypothetical protein
MKQVMVYVALGLAVVAWTHAMSIISPHISAWLVLPILPLP